MKKGFIVHPFETGNNKFHASYGDHNKTVQSFDTLKEAKDFLRKKGIKEALYDSPSGAKDIRLDQLKKIIKQKQKKSNPIEDLVKKELMF